MIANGLSRKKIEYNNTKKGFKCKLLEMHHQQNMHIITIKKKYNCSTPCFH